MDPYLYYTPPYVLLAIGLFAGVASGLAFQATLKMLVKAWAADSANRNLRTLRQDLALKVSFAGIFLGVCVFLASGVAIFAVPTNVAYGLAIPMSILTGVLVWWQLGKILVLLEEGGSAALDIESMF
jgi:hypothetical protein